MEKTVILNQEECGYSYFATIGKTIVACGLKGGVRKLDIIRVLVIKDNSKKHYSFLSRFGLCPAELKYNVDVDIYLGDGSVIEVRSSEAKFLKKLLPYIWELHKNPRIEFYGNTYLNGGRQ